MKAIVLEKIGGPDNLRIKEAPTPEPAAGEARVKLACAALNRRDYWLTVGRYPGTKLPCIAGSDGVGVVEAVGAGVDKNLLGKPALLYPARAWGDDEAAFGPDFRVLGMPDQGTFAECICVPAADVYTPPSHLSEEQAAAVPLAGLTAWRAVVTQGGLARGTAAGKKVLVTGVGGGVATFAVQWAARLGAEVWVTSGDPGKIERARAIGAVGGVSYKEADFHKTLKKKTGGFDVIIDSAAGASMNAVLDTLKPAGRYVFFGATAGNAAAGLEMIKLFFRQVRIQGTTMGSNREFAAMLDFVNAEKIEPVIDRVLPFDDAVAAHKLLENFSQTGKIVLRH